MKPPKLLGVARSTVEGWEGTPNDKSVNKRNLDVKVKVAPKEHARIAKRVKTGEPQAQVAADYGIGQQQVSRIATKEKKRQAVKAERKKAVAKLGSDTLVLDFHIFFRGRVT